MTRSWAPVRAVGLLAGIAALAAAPALAQTEEGIRIESDAVEIGIGGRVQTQFNTTTVDEVPESELILRRVRLELEVKLNDLVSGRLQPDFAGDRVTLKDVYLQLDFAPGLQLRTGKFYRPFSLLENTSSVRILPIERGLAIRGVDGFDEYELVHGLRYSDRDVGVQVMGSPEGAPLGLAYAAAVFQGPAHHVGDEATYQYVARTTVEPIEDLRFGAAWSNRAFSRGVAGAPGAFDIERGSAFEVDVEYGSFAPGFHLLGEVAVGDFDPFAADRFLGAQTWLAYRTGPMGRIAAVEPTLRLSYGDVDREGALEPSLGGTLVTPGLNFHLGGKSRVMFNYDVWLADGDAGNQGSFKTMFQLAF
jgi:hypothetical protein